MQTPDINALTPPRPKPIFYGQQSTFSKKKERISARVDLPPKLQPPRSKSIGRFKSKLKHSPRVKFISFKKNYTEPVNPFYNSATKQLYLTQCFEIKGNLGSGSFGDVYKVLSKEDKKYYAVKRTQIKYQSIADRSRKLKEVEKHENLPDHQNLVKFILAWEEQRHIYILTELCKISLCDYAEECHNICEESIWNYMIDLLQAIKHLHDNNLVHMDIKPENIFISYNDICKLGDFGLVLNINEEDDLYDASEGDPKYLAPEILQGNYSIAADIFSLGITILELAIDLDLPKGNELWHLLRSGQLPEDMLKEKSEDLKNIIKLMMEPDPINRKSATQLLYDGHISEENIKRALNRNNNNLILNNSNDKCIEDQISINLSDSEEENEEISCFRDHDIKEKLSYSSPSSDESLQNNLSPLSRPRAMTTPRRRQVNPLYYSASSSSSSFKTPSSYDRNFGSPLLPVSMKTDLFGSKMRRLTNTLDTLEEPGYRDISRCTPQNLSQVFSEMDKEDDYQDKFLKKFPQT